jgi:hypothetical protein
VQAKENAARPLAANQNPLGDLKRSGLKLVLIANRMVNILSQVAQILNVERVSRHRSAHSSRLDDGWEELPTGKNWQSGEGVSTGTIV